MNPTSAHQTSSPELAAPSQPAPAATPRALPASAPVESPRATSSGTSSPELAGSEAAIEGDLIAEAERIQRDIERHLASQTTRPLS